MQAEEHTQLDPGTQHSAWEVLRVYLRLGCTSFGGPIAHFGYLREEFVARRRWLNDAQFGELTALSQSLPGPASSQAGFIIGLLRAGWPGALAAWTGFTLPSALIMFGFACLHSSLEGPWAATLLHALQLVAVAVVAHAVLSMQRVLAPDLGRLAIVPFAMAAALLLPAKISGVGTILFGAACGLIFFRRSEVPSDADTLVSSISTRAGTICLGLFALLLALPPLLAARMHSFAVFDVFYRAGSLVFGGGHVVLPLLESATVSRGWLSQTAVLNGYSATQVLPGPLFTFATYLGASLNQPPNGLAGAAIATAGLFLPGLLLIVGVLPFWQQLRSVRLFQAVLKGINAAVIGLLAAALYNPVGVTALHHLPDFIIAGIGFWLLFFKRVLPWKVVALTVATTLALHALALHLHSPAWLQI